MASCTGITSSLISRMRLVSWQRSRPQPKSWIIIRIGLNVYNRVTVNLSTHDAGGITELDLKLAATMEKSRRNSNEEIVH